MVRTHCVIEWRGKTLPVTQDQKIYFSLLEPQDKDVWFCDHEIWLQKQLVSNAPTESAPAEEYTGGSSSYYSIYVEKPTTEGNPPYMAECNDIIEALGMNYAEGNAFKAIWRSCAAKLGKLKKGYDNGLYDAEKVKFFGNRMIEQSKLKQSKETN